MRRSKFKRPCKVLIFNGARVLVAIVRSLHCASELTHENKSAIHNCCTGKSVRSGAYYYRQLHPDILLEMDDLDNLTLKEYDDLCGVKRKYISTRKMARIRQRVKERQRECQRCLLTKRESSGFIGRSIAILDSLPGHKSACHISSLS